MKTPRIIQGGMGVAVSDWKLARAVSRLGQLGVVSGTTLDSVLARRLQMGDPGGHMRRAIEAFPVPDMARRIIDRYFVAGGKSAGRPFLSLPSFTISPRQDLLELTVVANFVEVFLAKAGHDGPIGINLLQKVEMPTLPSLYGAMLAGVGVVLMGAGIPREIPGALDALANHDEATLRLSVQGAGVEDDFRLRFDPREFFGGAPPPIARPQFLAIVSSATLASSLVKKSNGRIDGFVIEGSAAGGHNAPPRGQVQLSDRGEPVYGPRDRIDLARIADLGLPFWLAGAQARAESLREALAVGARGIQVGTVFALCRESGLDESIRRRLIEGLMAGKIRIFTDPIASPTGFPFKVVEGLDDTLAAVEPYRERQRVCDLGYLRSAYKRAEGKLGYRCAAEPERAYEKKGGDPADAIGRKCLCNALLGNIGLPQVRKDGRIEKPLVTCGDDLEVGVRRLVELYGESYAAADVIDDLLARPAPSRDSSPGPRHTLAPNRLPVIPTNA